MQVNGKKWFRLQVKALLLMTLLVGTSSYCVSLWAQPHKLLNNNSQERQIDFIPANTPPPDRGTPPANEGTGSRGECLYQKDMPPLTRLVGSHHLKLTVNEYPTFWLYVPYTPQQAPSGEFSLQDGDNEVYRTHFQLPATPGIVSITLPSTAPSLAEGKEYRWYFDINCPPSASSQESATPASLTGLVKRLALSSDLSQDLKAAPTPLAKIRTYARHGIWYETLTELAQLRLNEPQNSSLQQAWIELLSTQTVGLERIAQEPIIGSVKVSSSQSQFPTRVKDAQ